MNKRFISDSEYAEHKTRCLPVPKGESVKYSISRIDPVYFMVNQLGLKPFVWQAEMLDYLVRGKNVLACTSRQIGKTMALAVFALWACMHNTLPLPSSKKTRIVFVSKTEGQALKVISDVRELMRLGDDRVFELTGGKVERFFTNKIAKGENTTNSKSTISFENGCQIISLPPTDAARGYCLAKGTKIQIYAFNGAHLGGEKNVEEVLVGEVVQSLENLKSVPKRVTAVFDNGVKPCLRVVTETGKEVVCSHNHPFLCIEDDHAPDWKRADELYWHYELGNIRVATPRELITTPRDNIRDSNKLTEGFAIGAIIGDGCISGNKTEFVNTKKEILDAFVQSAKLSKYSFYSDNRFDRLAGVRFSKENDFYNRLVQMDLVGKHSWEKRLPSYVFSESAKYRKDVLAGLWATDGWFCVDKNRVDSTFCTCNKELALDVQRLLLTFGIKSNLRFREQGKRDIWWVQIRANKYNDLFNRIVEVPGKREKQKEVLAMCAKKVNQADTNSMFDVVWEKVVKVEDAGERETFDITVEDTHCMVSNGIITHNTGSQLFIDEVAFIPDDVITNVLLPIVAATGYRVSCTSTPNGRQGWFYKNFDPEDGLPDHPFVRMWCPYDVIRQDDPDRCERLDKEHQLRIRQGEERSFLQEYEASFEASASSFFTQEQINNCIDDRLEVVQESQLECDAGIDFGVLNSRTVVTITTLVKQKDKEPFIRVLWQYEYGENKGVGQDLVNDFGVLMKKYKIQRIVAEACPASTYFMQAAKEKGWPLTEFVPAADKDRQYHKLRAWMQQGLVKMPNITELIKQMRGLCIVQLPTKARIEHGSGLRDDCIDSLMMATFHQTEEKGKLRVLV